MRDVTNPAPKTQENLERLGVFDAPFVDEFLRETCRRLLGQRPGSTEQLRIHLDPMKMGQQKAWVHAAKYLDKRIQGMPEDRPGRAPDMSQQAAAAMRAVMYEVAGLASL